MSGDVLVPADPSIEAREAAFLHWEDWAGFSDAMSPTARWAFDFGWNHQGVAPRDFAGRPRTAYLAGRRAARAYRKAAQATDAQAHAGEVAR